MAKFKIIIKGIALSYIKKDNVWRLLFPFDRCHTVKLKLDEHDPGISLASPGALIDVTTGANTLSKGGAKSTYRNFLDLTADRMHDDGLVLRDDWEKSAVRMKIANALFSVYEMTKTRIAVTEDGEEKIPADYIGDTGLAEIESDELIIKVSGAKNFSMRFTADTTVTFYNDCDNTSEIAFTDMAMLYWVVKDKEKPRRQFSVAEEGAQRSSITPAAQPSVMPGGPQVATPDGRAERVMGVAGLPCHKVRVSDSGDFPDF